MISIACMCDICVVRRCRSNAGAAKMAITFRCGIITSRLGFPTQFRSRFLMSCRNFLHQPSAFFHSYICPFWRYLRYSGKRCVFWPIGRVQLTVWFCSTLPTCKQLTKYTTGTQRERDWPSRYAIPPRFSQYVADNCSWQIPSGRSEEKV